jgi:peptidoglycan hydrolase CwlO-like protein
MSTAYRGNTINVSASNVDMIEEKEKHHTELRALEEEKKSLMERIYAPGAQPEEAMHRLDEVETEIEGIKAHMKKYGLEGGRRKSHRQKSRRSKSRRSKSRRSKSRRSKH